MLRFKLIFVLFAAVALAQRAMTVEQVREFIKSQIKLKADDRKTGEFLKTIKLTQKLEDKTVEELQGLGAGPKTVAALRKLEEDSASLAAAPPPPAPVVAVQPPAPDSMEQEEMTIATSHLASRLMSTD